MFCLLKIFYFTDNDLKHFSDWLKVIHSHRILAITLTSWQFYFYTSCCSLSGVRLKIIFFSQLSLFKI